MYKLELVSRDSCAVSFHLPALRPFLQSFHRYKLGGQNGLNEEADLIQGGKQTTFVNPRMYHHPVTKKYGKKAGINQSQCSAP
jgi:hypothetical protein